MQQASWPVIADGEHALITAPTGSLCKTLTAFLWSLSQFADGRLKTGSAKVLYVSPLKALNNDIQRNLLTPLTELVADYNMPPLQVRVRSGDTEQSERQRMLRKPPDESDYHPRKFVPNADHSKKAKPPCKASPP